MKTDKIGDIIGYWLGNRKNVMDFNLLEKGIQDLLDKQKEEIKEKIKNMRKKEQCLLNDLGYHTKDCENCEYNSAISDILKELNK